MCGTAYRDAEAQEVGLLRQVLAIVTVNVKDLQGCLKIYLPVTYVKKTNTPKLFTLSFNIFPSCDM